MNSRNDISFNQETIEILFPFFIQIDENLKIVNTGKSLSKILKNITGKPFEDIFVFKRPFSVEYSLKSISEYLNQIIILDNKLRKDFLLRGQLLLLNNQLLFLGSPWITKEDDFNKLNLNISDFAIHDGVTDMVQLLNTKEIITKDITQLYQSLKNQKKELEISEKLLKNINNRLSILISNFNGAILLEDENRKIVLVNDNFCSLFKIPVSPDLMIGADCTNAAEESKALFKDSQLFVERINLILENKKIVQNEEIELKDGTFLERDFIPIFSNYVYHGHLWIYKDISQRKKFEIDTLIAKENAIKEKKIKEQFMANMSHELRNPLNIITGITSLFENKNLNKTQKEYLDIIKKSSENLLLLVNDILDFEKIEAKKIEFNKSPIDIRNLIKECVDSLKFQSDNKKLILKTNINQSTPKTLLLDPLRLKQILINLINNAIKFTDEGSVTINLKSEKLNKNTIELQIEVIDTGIGIPIKEQKNLFQRFNQINPMNKSTYGGTGLGLTIVKNLIELQDGSIIFKSKPGIGSSFTVKFPCEGVKTSSSIRKNSLKLIPKKNSLKILIVEDNSLNQLIISKMLEKTITLVDIAENGKIALDKLIHNSYDLILMDLHMPVMDGFEATKRIRKLENSEKSKTPIIALTANILSKEKEKCFRLGMNGYLNKPVSEYILIENINSICNKQNKLFDLDYLRSIDPDDSSFLVKTIKEFIITSQKLFSNLKVAVSSNNFKDIYEIAHKLKGMFAYIGSTELKIICNKIEEESISVKNINIINTYIHEINETLPKIINELKFEIKKK